MSIYDYLKCLADDFGRLTLRPSWLIPNQALTPIWWRVTH